MPCQSFVFLLVLMTVPGLWASICDIVCDSDEFDQSMKDFCRCNAAKIVNTAGQSRNPVQPGYKRPYRPQRPHQPVRVVSSPSYR